jgi:long-subunit fatty acid transport protein
VSGGTSRGKVEGPICKAVEVQASGQLLKSVSLGLSVPDSAILSWVIEFNPQWNLITLMMGSV